MLLQSVFMFATQPFHLWMHAPCNAFKKHNCSNGIAAATLRVQCRSVFHFFRYTHVKCHDTSQDLFAREFRLLWIAQSSELYMAYVDIVNGIDMRTCSCRSPCLLELHKPAILPLVKSAEKRAENCFQWHTKSCRTSLAAMSQFYGIERQKLK